MSSGERAKRGEKGQSKGAEQKSSDKQKTVNKAAKEKSTAVAKPVDWISAKGPRRRAFNLVSKFAGPFVADAQRTKWLLDLVVDIDREYSGVIKENQKQTKILEATNQQHEVERSQLQQQVDELSKRLTEATTLNIAAQAAQAAAEAEVLQVKSALAKAEDAASAATEECAALHQALTGVTREDSRARRILALRSYDLKENLLRTKHDLKSHRHTLRLQEARIGLLQREKERATVEMTESHQKQHAELLKRIAELQGKLKAVKSHRKQVIGTTKTMEVEPKPVQVDTAAKPLSKPLIQDSVLARELAGCNVLFSCEPCSKP